MKTDAKKPSAAREEELRELGKEFENYSLTQIRIHGFRITMPRVQVIQALGDTDVAMTPYDIHQKILNKGGRIDVVSVYRILDTLTGIGLVHRIGAADGYFPSRISGPNQRDAAHFVDVETGHVVEVEFPKPCKEYFVAESISRGFELRAVKVEVIGTYKKN